MRGRPRKQRLRDDVGVRDYVI